MDDSLVTALHRARRVVALTGAGISAESGVPTFRGPDGLWQSFRVEDLATPEAFARDPDLVWRWYRWRREQIAAARPNAGHEALARLADRGPEFRLLTQNVDGLHQRAGSRDVVELHGNLWRSRCTREPGRRFEDFGAPREDDGLPRCPCGALRRPDVVWFGELLDREALEAAFDAAASCDVLLVVGTSAVVYPVAAIPEAARAAGARIVEINVQDTPLTAFAHHAIRQPAAVALPAIEEAW